MDSAADFDLERHVPYLLNRVAAHCVDAFGAQLADAELTVPMWRILSVLWHGGRVRVGDLAVHTSLEPSTLSRIVRGLERQKLVSRARSRSDDRVVEISLTRRGRSTIERLFPAADMTEEQLLSGFSDEERELLRRFLTRLYGNVPLSGIGRRDVSA